MIIVDLNSSTRISSESIQEFIVVDNNISPLYSIIFNFICLLAGMYFNFLKKKKRKNL